MKQALLSQNVSSKNNINSQEIKLLGTGFSHANSPLWHPDGYLLFSAVSSNKIFQLYLNGVMHVMLTNSGGMYIAQQHLSDLTGANGLALDEEKNLIFCQQGSHGIAKMSRNKNVVQLCCSYNGRPFNSPADIVIKTNGALYFTDPAFGLKGQKLNAAIFQPFSGVYSFYNNSVSLLINDVICPAGVCFSPDEKYLFVSSNSSAQPYIYRYRLTATGAIMGKQIFATVPNAGGIKTDRIGNLYAATSKGIIVFDENGQIKNNIAVPEKPTNITFGGSSENLLFITSAKSVYYIDISGIEPLPGLPKSEAKFAKQRESLSVN